MGEMRFLCFGAGPPPVFRGGGLEAGSDCQLGQRRARLLAPRGLPSPAIPGHLLGCLVAGGEPGQPGDNIRYRLWTFFPGAAGTKG